MSSSPTSIPANDKRECNLGDITPPKDIGTENSSLSASTSTSPSGPPSPSGSYASFDGYLAEIAKQAMWRSISSGSVPDDATDSRDETFKRRQRQRSGWINSSAIKGFYSSLRGGKDVNSTNSAVNACVTGGGERLCRQNSFDISGASVTESTPDDDELENEVSTSRLSRKNKFQTTIRRKKKDMVNSLRSMTSVTSMTSSATGSNGSFDSTGTISSMSSRTTVDPGCLNGTDRRPTLPDGTTTGQSNETLTRRRTGHHRQRRSNDTVESQQSIQNLQGFGSDDSSSTDDGGSSGIPESMASFSLNDVDDVLDESLSPTDAAKGLATKAVSDEDQLNRIVDELVTTEKRYVSRLAVLATVKVETSAMLTPEVAKNMFQNIEVLHEFHKEKFLPKLQQRLLNWSTCKKLGDIMTTSVPFLKLYTDYVTNLNAGSQLVEVWAEKNKKFAALVKEIKDNPKYGRLTLQAHMLEPIQRVPRYQLLLREYLKKLPKDSDDRTDISKALEVISDVAGHFEVMLQRDANMSELLQTQKQLLGFGVNIVSHDRHLVRRGHVTTVNLAGKRSDKYAFLFNDILLVCIERPLVSKFQVKQQMSLKQTKVSSANNLTIPHTFVVRCHDKSIELAFSDESEKNLWEQDILSQIKELTKKKLQQQFEAVEPEVRITRYAAYSVGEVAPVLVRKDSVNSCNQCAKEFVKETRKHHCRACGNVFCRRCASHDATLMYDRQGALRVCDVCFVKLSDEATSSSSRARQTTQPTTTSVRDDVVERDYLQISADTGATWCTRWFVVFETGKLSTYKTEKNTEPLASMTLNSSHYHVRLVNVDLPQSQAINLFSKEKSYLLHSDQRSTIERWFKTLSRLSYHRLSRPTQV